MRKNSLTSEDEGAKRVRMPSTKLKELSPYLSKKRPSAKNRAEPRPQSQPQLQPPPVFPRHMPQNEDTVLVHVQPSTSATPPRALTPVQSDRDHIILRALEELKVQVRQNTLLLQALTSRQPVQNTSQLSEEYKFPMTCDEDLTRVEELLDKPQKKALTAYPATLGGCNTGDVVRPMLRHILHDEFAQQFNWLGRGGRKKAFSAFKITAVIRGV
ncbi:uncharacterized protein LOC143135403 [Alosa pseudoharengus]|uniref:uncharacterized protein LOC143135403 n=1 Tax=Alosa pseudoharengus TaxID=34774 RepID=UPI003F8B999E